MNRYQWSELNKQQVGAFTEYFVKMEFTMLGFQVYTTEVDDRGIDFVTRHQNGQFLQIQVKSARVCPGKNNYVFIQKSKFARDKTELRDNLFLALGLLRDGEEPQLYLISSTVWREKGKVFVERDYAGLKSKPEWGVNLSKRNLQSLERYRFHDVAENLTFPLKNQIKVIESFGTIDFDPAYDHKAARESKTQRSRAGE